MTEIICITDKHHPALPAIIQWLYDWWGKDEDYTKEQVEAYVRNAVCKDRIPQVFLILQDGVPAGTFQFAMSDIDTRPDCYPWLRDFWIQPAFRGKGLTYTVMEAVKDHAARLHLTELYLFTRHEGLYEKFGWEYIETFPTYLTNSVFTACPFVKIDFLETKNSIQGKNLLDAVSFFLNLPSGR